MSGTITARARAEFDAAVKGLRETEPGKEATMYTLIRDLFVDMLGYPKTSVVVDTAGARGRPDLTVYAPGGDSASRISWIVMEAKDEPNAVSSAAKRIKLYSEKAKYITADTAYFVMVDPKMLVARGTGLGRQAVADLEVPWIGLTPEKFLETLAPLRHEVAGVPAVMDKFRAGDLTLIACDPLSAEATATPTLKLAAQVTRNVFFDTLTETTRLLQKAALHALVPLHSGFDGLR